MPSSTHAFASRPSTAQPSSTVPPSDDGVGGTEAAHAPLVVADDVEGEPAGERQQVGVVDDVVDEAPLEGLVGGEEVAGVAHLPGPPQADGLREQHGQTPTRHDADAAVGVTEAGPLGGHEEVAGRAPPRSRR